ncbi:MAG TPA: DUF362 domain-containing protein [Terriglobia bacterium]|nr:DUF362 domain-containing protein [Terriglobia bacterium]
MAKNMDRRQFIQGLGGAAAGLSVASRFGWPTRSLLAASPARTLPTAPVAVAKCADYGSAVRPTLATLFDQLGGVERLVKGKTVAIKLNLTGGAGDSLRGLPKGETYWVHPEVVGSTISLLNSAGARRIRLVESSLGRSSSLQEFMQKAGWNYRDFAGAASDVEFEDTNYAGPSGKYVRLSVPGGGLLFPAYDVNHSYHDCDVYVSLAKLKEHATAGVTLSMKNSFGVPPVTIYGADAGIDEPARVAGGSRSMLHDGDRQPSKSALPEKDPSSPRDPGYRVPRVTVDVALARPIHLAIIDGVSTVAGGEGPWIRRCRPVHAGVLIAGTNPVTTDAVGAALMGFDPMADHGTAPFEGCDSTLKLAEQAGIGTRDLKKIEVIGMPIGKARTDFRAA